MKNRLAFVGILSRGSYPMRFVARRRDHHHPIHERPVTGAGSTAAV